MICPLNTLIAELDVTLVPVKLVNLASPVPSTKAFIVPLFCWKVTTLSLSEPLPTLKSTAPLVASVIISGLDELSYAVCNVSAAEPPPPPVPANLPCGIMVAESKSVSPSCAIITATK